MQVKSNQQRISVLKGILKFLLFIFIIIIVWQGFFAGQQASYEATETFSITIEEQAFVRDTAYLQVELLKGRPLLILRYSESDKDCLGETSADWYVAWAQGTDMGCPLERVDADSASKRLGYSVCRGLQDQCRGSIYQLNGDVYAGQLATKNLLSPNYRLEQQDDQLLLLIDVPQ